MKRGEIYYLSIPTNTTTGCDIMYDRPAIIVSHDALNATSGTVTVIPCSTSMRRKMRCHVEIGSASRACHAMIEQLTTVDKSRLSNRVGELTPEEMHRLDAAMADFLALPTSGEAVEGERDLRMEDAEIVDRCGNTVAQFVPKQSDGEIDALRAELAVYKHLYNDLLGRVVKSA